ncbi:MAG: thermonuclease family protein [Deltaproteobacteria bacterium]|nr:thermonuclease family protein [Deltaproteobacteria bacterium]MBW1819431.1 thermonuclease family protein [Deltaproteobacteria bacterium]
MTVGKLFFLVVLNVLFLAAVSVNYHHAAFVLDGDTIRLRNGQSVRYLGIDSPEIGRDGKMDEFLAKEARDFNRRLVMDSKIRLAYDKEKTDRYGRRLAYVFLDNGEMVNALLVENGMAHVLSRKPNLKYSTLLLDCQKRAMEKGLGIWSGTVEKKEAFYLGNSASFRFHRPGCPFGSKMKQRNRVEFKTRFDAFWQGYSPCKRCRP